MRVVAGRQTGLDIPATPFTQPAEEKRQYRGLMFYGSSSFANLQWEKNATPACHVPSTRLNVRDGRN